MTSPADKLSRREVLAAAALAVPSVAAAAARVARGPKGYRKGVCIYHMMEGLALTPGRTYVWPPYQGPDFEMPDAWMRELRSTGFDFVRLAIAPDIFMRTTGAERAQVDAALAAKVGGFLDAGLNVIADLHPGNRIAGFKQVDFVTNPQTFQAHAALVEELARLLSRFPQDRVALELLNEPETTPGRWAGQMRTLHARARKGSANLLLVLTGAQSSFDHLPQVDANAYAGSNTLFTFHYYEPHVFTHQNIPDRRYLTRVPWPTTAGRFDDAFAVAAANIARDRSLGPKAADAARGNARSLLQKYFREGSAPANVTRHFATVQAWSARHRIAPQRIVVGEIGVNATENGFDGAAAEDRDRWLRTVRGAAEAAGFGWAFWCYSGPSGMSLVDQGPPRRLDPAILKALGLA
jgi:hypothetical protein